MIVLDTDHVSLLEWDYDGSAPLRERLADLSGNEVATTIISYEESMRGWMAYIARARNVSQQVQGYRRLRRHLENYRQIPMLDFDEDAGAEYQRRISATPPSTHSHRDHGPENRRHRAGDRGNTAFAKSSRL